MKSLWKKIICFVLPVVMVAIVCMAVVLPLANKSKTTKTTTDTTLLAREPIYYASAEDTGASTASSSEKGGAIYVGVDSTYTMKGGTISGKSKKYGGAVYVSSGATFTMEGGTITSCTARYGGAIYVASGATCNITGGTITGNSATYAPAIYVEDGGILNIDGDALVDNNTYLEPAVTLTKISEDTALVGGNHEGTVSTLYLHYVEFGNYPQTYVGDDMNTTLESWYGTSNPSVVNTYNTRVSGSYGSWSGYMYTDGNIYVRGISNRYNSNNIDASDYTYADGTTVKASGTVVWFKVEPIKWFVLNYDEYLAGTAGQLELMSELVLTANIIYSSTASDENSWATSYIRGWLNDTFMESAFSKEEQYIIALSELKNNTIGDYTDGTGTTTYDYIYLKSYSEMGVGQWGEMVGYTDINSELAYATRLCSPTDFALSNWCYLYTDLNSTTTYRTTGGTTYYFLRSMGLSASYSCYVSFIGGLYTNDGVGYMGTGLRPALKLTV